MPAETSRSISLNVLAKMDAFRDKMLKDFPGITAEAANKAALKLQSQFTSEAVKQFKQVDRAASGTAGKFSALGKQIAASVGGPLGSMSAKVLEVSEALGGTASKLALVGSAVAGVVGGFALFTLGVKLLADRALEAQKRLVAAGKAAEIPQAAKDSLDKYSKAMKELGENADKAQISLGAIAADFLTPLIRAFNDAGKTQRDFLIEGVAEGKGLSGVYKDIYTGATRILGPLKSDKLATEELAQARKDAAKAQTEFDALVKSHAEFEANRLNSLTAAALRKEKAEKKASDATIESLRQADRAFAHSRKHNEEKDAESLETRVALHQAWFDAGVALEQAAFDIFASLNDRKMELAQRELDTELAQMDAMDSRREELREKLRNAEDEDAKRRILNQLQSLNANIHAQRAQVAAAKEAIRKIAVANKVAAIFGATIDTAAAIAKTLASVPFPANIPLGIAAGVAGGAQIAAIASQPLPSFFRGTSRVPEQRGESMMATHGGEAVVTAGGVEKLGRLLVDSLNSGLSPLQGLAGAGGGGGTLVMDGDAVGRVLARRVSGSGPLAESIHGRKPVGYRSPWGRN